jgi:hypothetical protein
VLIHRLAVAQLFKPVIAIADNLIGCGTDGLGHLYKLGFAQFFSFHVVVVFVDEWICL